MFIKVKKVEPLQNLILRVTFENGVIKKYDINPVMDKIDDFKALKDEKIFKNVKTDLGGFGISWNDYIDLECSELWENGIEEDN